MADTYQLSQQRTYLEEITHTADDASFPGSAYELQLLNKAYQKSAYKYSWPSTLKRWFDALVANVDRYTLPTDFNKFIFLKSQGFSMDPTDVEHVTGGMNREYAVALDSLEYLLSLTPTTATTAHVSSGSLVAGNAVAITVDSVDGLSAGDEIFISDTTSSEFTKIQSVDTTLVTITVKLKNNHATAKNIYRVNDGNYFQYQKAITLLSDPADVMIIPGSTHLAVPHYSAYLYYTDIEEPDRAATHLGIWTSELSDAWLGLGKTSAGEAGQFTL